MIGRKTQRAPKRAPRKLDRMSDADLLAALQEREAFIQSVNAATKTIPVAEHEATLARVRGTVDDMKRLQAEQARRSEAVTSTPADVIVDPPRPGEPRVAVRAGLAPSDRMRVAHEMREQMKAKQEAKWERRERERRERAEAMREGAKAREAERRARLAADGLAPENPGDWSGWNTEAADTLAAVFSNPSLWHDWLGRDPERLDRDPPLHSSHAVVLYAVLATMAARGTSEIVVTPRASSGWMPVGFVADAGGAGNATSCVKHLAANGWLTVRPGDGGGLIVGRGPMAEAVRAAYVKRGRTPQEP